METVHWEKLTVVVECAGRERFVDRDDVGMPEARPCLNGTERGLVHQTEILERPDRQ